MLRSFISALLLLGIPLGIAGQSTPISPGEKRESPRLTQKVIPVSDLITAIPDFDPACCLAASGGVTCNARTARRLDEELIALIQKSVAPASWKEGGGTIDYYPIGQAFVVKNAPEVIEEVVALLESLRKLQENQVSVEIRLISLGEAAFEKLGTASFCSEDRQKECAAQWFQHRCAPLSEDEIRTLLSQVQEDANCAVLQTPKCTMFDGQKAFIKIDNEQTRLSWKMQPRISADRQFTGLSLTLQLNDARHETVLCVPAGGYCLIGGLHLEHRGEYGPPILSQIPYLNRLFKNVYISRQPTVALVKVTPLCNATPICVKGITGNPAPMTVSEPPTEVSTPTPPTENLELLQEYLDACSRGDMPQIKKTHRELSKRALERELESVKPRWTLGSTDAITQQAASNPEKISSPIPDMLPWTNRWFGEDAPKPHGNEIVQIAFEIRLGSPLDAHEEWNQRWFSNFVDLKVEISNDEEPVSWSKPGPQKMQRIGVNQK